MDGLLQHYWTKNMDYIISDPNLIHSGEEKFYSEEAFIYLKFGILIVVLILREMKIPSFSEEQIFHFWIF